MINVCHLYGRLIIDQFENILASEERAFNHSCICKLDINFPDDIFRIDPENSESHRRIGRPTL